MAQTGYTPILIYSSTTASQAPAAGNLTNSTLGSELAINITDGKLFYKDNANAVQVIGWKTTPTTAGGTGLTSYTAGDLLYYATGTTLSKLAIGASGRWLGSSGTAPQWNAPAALTKTDDTNVTLTLGGSASTALLNAASLTLGWTGTLATTRGGTGLSSFTANGVLYASSTSALATTSTFAFDGSNLGLGVAANASTRFSLYRADNTVYTSGARGYPWQQIYNTSTTSGAYSGLEIGVDGVGNGSLATLAAIDAGSGTTEFAISTRVSNTFADALYIDSSRNIKFVSGNLTQGTAAKGINFTANSALAGKTSQLLNYYEEGTYTPTVTASSGAITTYSATGNYTRTGRQVTANIQVTLTNAGTASGALVATLPFTCGLFPAIGCGREDQNTGLMLQARIASGTPTVAAILTYANLTAIATGNVVQITITYFV